MNLTKAIYGADKVVGLSILQQETSPGKRFHVVVPFLTEKLPLEQANYLIPLLNQAFILLEEKMQEEEPTDG